jgi:hypothetical protein
MAQFNDHLTYLLQHTQVDFTQDTEVVENCSNAMEECLALGDSGSGIKSNNNNINSKRLPIGIVTEDTLQGQQSRRPLRVLFDSGSSRTIMNAKVVPSSLLAHQLKAPSVLSTGGGTVEAELGVWCQGIRFPELSPTRICTTAVEALVSAHTSRYDVVLGFDVMVSARTARCFETQPFDGATARCNGHTPTFSRKAGEIYFLA